MRKEDIQNQCIGAYIEHLNSIREEDIRKIIEELSINLNEELSKQDKNLIKALAYVQNVKEFVGKPEEILGSNLTKHGEIAEQIDVNIGNARIVLEGLKEKFTFESVGRTAPEDYIDGVNQVQSKFYNGMNNTLKAVLEHKEKYQYFGSNGESYYSIPKEYYETIEKILNNENIDNINERTIQRARELIIKIEEETNRPFREVVKPSISKYSEVQMGNVDETLEKEELYLKNKSLENKEDIKEKIDKEKNEKLAKVGPSFNEGMKVTAIAAALSGGISFTIGIVKKKKERGTLTNFNIEDWREIGIDTGKGTAKGGISGASIYTLTNFLKTPAPLASAYVSASFGIVNLAKEYRKGNINSEEFIENSELVCIDSAISAIGAGLGTVIIPIPVLGAVIGGIVFNTINSIGKEYLDKDERKLIDSYSNRYNREIERLDKENKIILTQIMREYYRLGEMINMAFDFRLNAELRFQKSKELAKNLGVNNEEILKNKKEINSYFLD